MQLPSATDPHLSRPGRVQEECEQGRRGELRKPTYLRAEGARSQVAVGETVILLTPPSPSLLKHLIKGEGGAAE